MPIFTNDLPLSLYIHLPWCIRKCPYCDFNSHTIPNNLPEKAYVAALLQELDNYLPLITHRPLISIFFGGGTPSLFSGDAIKTILQSIQNRMIFARDIEITLEANPGTVDYARFSDFRAAGINRLSLGIQSLQDDKLKTLGRIHDKNNALEAIRIARAAGFDNFNLDMMYGLPQQTLTDALLDLEIALSFQPTHFSWYQLTIEPNTLFHHQPPVLPHDDIIWEMQLAGQQFIHQAGLQQYEVSAYAKPGFECKHNRNYWEFGDYLGIGAGAHSKITDSKHHTVTRFAQVKHPQDYLQVEKRIAQPYQINTDDNLIFEFMLNALRLTQGVPLSLFTQRTGLASETLATKLQLARSKGFLDYDGTHIRTTDHGKKFLNNLMQLFL